MPHPDDEGITGALGLRLQLPSQSPIHHLRPDGNYCTIAFVSPAVDRHADVPMHTPVPSGELREIAHMFALGGECVGGVLYGSGHINDTFALELRGDPARRRVILQRINDQVFKDVPALMENIVRVTRHLHGVIKQRAAGPTRETALTLVPTRAGAPVWRDAHGRWWRMYEFIERARTYDGLSAPAQARAVAAAFGRFQHDLAHLPPQLLHETIPHFHDTPWRLAQLEEAVARDVCGRVAHVADELAFVRAHAHLAGVLCDQLASGAVPMRVTHNDTKINNVMLDDETGHGVCVIDLDTVMPGHALVDFGDCVRTGAARAAEDERDLARVGVNLELFAALVDGYLESMGARMTPAELAALHLSGQVITFENGVRFLTDFLAGDVYFAIKTPDHNVARARAQFRMVQCMAREEETMRAIVARYARQHAGDAARHM